MAGNNNIGGMTSMSGADVGALSGLQGSTFTNLTAAAKDQSPQGPSISGAPSTVTAGGKLRKGRAALAGRSLPVETAPSF